MALFSECTQSCVHMVLDIADIVRDGDVTSTDNLLTASIACPITSLPDIC
jgi:hypothetical protein